MAGGVTGPARRPRLGEQRHTAPLPGQWADRPAGGCCTETVTARNNTARTIRNESAYPQVDLKSFKGSLPIEEIS